MNGSVEFIRFTDVIADSTLDIISTRNIFVHPWGKYPTLIGPACSKYTCRAYIPITCQNDFREADKLDTTVDGYTANERNTESSGIVECTPKSIFRKEIKKFDSSSRMNFLNSVRVKTPDVVSFRDPTIHTDNVLDRRSGGVATRIADKNGIWEPKPSDIGTAATHDEIKNISENLAYRKFIKDLDFETSKVLEREHKERVNIKEIETRLSMNRIDEQKMENIEERENIDDIPTRIEMI